MGRVEDARRAYLPGIDPERLARAEESSDYTTPGDIAAQTIQSPRGEDAPFPRIIQVPAPELTPPPGSLDAIRLVSAITVGVNDVQNLFSWDVPNGMVLIVRALDFFINDMVAATNITFTLLFKGGPIPGWDAVGIFPRVAASVATTFDQTVLRLAGAGTFAARSNNVDGGNHLVGAGFQGYQMTLETYRKFGGTLV